MRILLKILSIAAILAILSALGYFIYKIIYKTAPPSVPSAATTAKAPVAGTMAPELKTLSQGPLVGYWMNSKTNAIFYATPEGRIVKTFGDGRDEEVNKQVLPGLHSIIPSPDGSMAIAVFGYPTGQVIAVYDTVLNSWERLPAGAIAASFDPTSQKVAFIRRTNGDAGIFVFNSGDKKITELMKLNAADGELRWLSPDLLRLTEKPSSDITVNVWDINTKSRTVKKLSSGADAFAISWSEDGTIGLKLVKSDLIQSNLIMIHGSGAEIQPISFLTLPSKCVFSGTILYCGVPAELPARADLPDDYIKYKFYSRDNIISLDTETGEQTSIFEALFMPIDADQLSVQGNKLYFRNRYDQKLYLLELPKLKETPQ